MHRKQFAANRLKVAVGSHVSVKVKAQFKHLLDQQSALCDELEAIADCLPDSANPQSILRTAQRLLTIVKNGHDFEEDTLFPILETNSIQKEPFTPTLERLRYEHWGDEEFAVDVYHALREFVRLRDKANIDSLAWMLHGFFEGLRRHIAFDREVLLPMILETRC